MKKASFLILVYLITNIFLNTMAQAKNAVINPDYQKEEFHWCPSMEEAGYWTEKYIDKYNCIAASINLYSKQQREIALDFAKKFIPQLKHKNNKNVYDKSEHESN